MWQRNSIKNQYQLLSKERNKSCTCFINYDNRYQLSSESLLEAFGKKDPDEISNMRDDLAQKLAEKLVKRYIKDLCDSPKKDETIISHL